MYEEKNDQVANRLKAKNTTTNGFEHNIIVENDDYELFDINNQNNTTEPKNLGIVISNATAKWTNVQTENSLENITLTIRPGRLVAIIGPVGAGKVYIIYAN